MTFKSKSILVSIRTIDLPGQSPLNTSDMYPFQPVQDFGSVLGLKRKACHSVSKCRSLGCNEGKVISFIFGNVSSKRGVFDTTIPIPWRTPLPSKEAL